MVLCPLSVAFSYRSADTLSNFIRVIKTLYNHAHVTLILTWSIRLQKRPFSKIMCLDLK